MEVCCDEYAENVIYQLRSMIAVAQMNGAKHNMLAFKFCPYCGKPQGTQDKSKSLEKKDV